MRSRVPHKNLNILSSTRFIIPSGTLRHVATYVTFEIARDLIIQTFPNIVKFRFSACFSTSSILISLSSKFSLKHSF